MSKREEVEVVEAEVVPDEERFDPERRAKAKVFAHVYGQVLAQPVVLEGEFTRVDR